MTTKLKAAKRILKHDRMMILANGENPSIIFKIMNGDKIGTLFRKNEVKIMVISLEEMGKRPGSQLLSWHRRRLP